MAWDYRGVESEWEGAFALYFGDGNYCYLFAGCDYYGWSCHGRASLKFSESFTGLEIPESENWELYPADLNLWIEKVYKSPN